MEGGYFVDFQKRKKDISRPSIIENSFDSDDVDVSENYEKNEYNGRKLSFEDNNSS